MLKHEKNIKREGKPIEEAEKALVLVHGRGATAEDIISIAQHLDVKDFSLLAPQASNHNSWYPLSFLAPVDKNEPLLSSALEQLGEIEEELNQKGIASENIYFFGFSQGACLTLEYIARNAKKYGGAVAIIGGLIGDKINTENYKAGFENTPVFLGTSDPDMHVPLERVKESAEVLRSKGADVRLEVYENAGHSILQEEVEIANSFVFNI